jgi:folate-dependent phosphoribosylglycinamide formyltransferase PurN
MKIVAMIGSESAPLVYFANALHAHSELTLLIVEQSSEKPIIVDRNSFKIPLFYKIINYAKFRLEKFVEKHNSKKRDRNQIKIYNDLYGNIWQKINTNIQILYTQDINSKEVIEALIHLKPDVILNHGTSIVKKDVLTTTPVTLNLHWGLSPYYRGVESTLHALLNCDPLNIGVTIHKLSSKIDGGDILTQERIEIFENDTADSIPPRLTLKGTELMKHAIDVLAAGGGLNFVEHKSLEGFLFRDSHWNSHTHQFGKGMSPFEMKSMLQHPSRQALPIISFDFQGNKQ